MDVPLAKADPDEYDALLLPGGVMNPDKLRMDARANRYEIRRDVAEAYLASRGS